MAISATASATTIDVSVSGQFTPGVTADVTAAPGATWSLSFDVDSNPVAGNSDALGFDAPFSNFTYTLGGTSVVIAPLSIRLYTTAGGGLFTLFFGPETGFNNGQPIPEFSFSGSQMFSGSTTAPAILAGNYPITDVLYSDSLNFDDEGASGSVTASGTTTPEPSTLCSFGLAVILLALLKRSGTPHVSQAVQLCDGDGHRHGRRTRRVRSGTTLMLALAFCLATLPEQAKAQQQIQVSIVLTQPLTDTGVYLTQGESVTVTSTGEMNWFTDGCPTAGACVTTPDGQPWSVCESYTPAYTFPGLSCWSLVGQIGASGAAFQVGSSKTITASVSGELYLGVNDNNYPDNTGSWISTIQIQNANGKSQGDCSCKYSSTNNTFSPAAGDPIDIASGNMFYAVTDYKTAGQNPLAFTRYYNSQANNVFYQPVSGPAVASKISVTGLGGNWRSTFDRTLFFSSDGSVTAVRADGRQLLFIPVGSAWLTYGDVDVQLTNSGNNWTLADHDDTTETYTRVFSGGSASNIAQLNSIKARNGYLQTLNYAGSELTNVTDSYGRSLVFTYSAGLLNSVSTPDGLTVSFTYDALPAAPRLTAVTYSTTPASTQTYLYENATVPYALTGIIDENNNRYATWTYDSSARGLSSQLGAGAGLTTVVYNSDGSRLVTNALGVKHTYKYQYLQGIPKVIEITRAATTTTAAATELFAYDSNGYLTSQTDWNGNKTTFVNDTHGDPTTINEAVGSPVARATAIAYDATFVHLPERIVTPGLAVSFTYDSAGELLTRTVADTTTTTVPYSTSGQLRIWTNSWANFLLMSTQTPNGNTTSYGYDGSGALTSVKNALGQATNVATHTGGGLPLTVVDPNGVTTTLTYDARQRLLTSSVATSQGPRTTAFTYDPAGNLTKTTLPDGSALTNTYDTAHRLTTITDLFHQNVDYALDTLGDHTATNLTAVGNRIRRQHSTTFDTLGRVLSDIGGMGQTTVYAYDPNGNALSVTDPLGRPTSRVYDGLNRLSKTTDPNSGVTILSYDVHDRIVSITDPNGNVTAYTYDGPGNLIQQKSPDSGTTVYHYDGDGNLTSKTDARGIVTNNTYDPLDRILTTTYPSDPAEYVAYKYDESGHGFGIGRLTSLIDTAGSLSRTYDERGNLLTDTRVNGATTLKTVYTYDAASRIASMTYPSGWTASYTRDIMGRIWQIPLTAPGGVAAGNAITNATYEPYGPLYTLTFGNGVSESRTFDLDYRVTNLVDSGAVSLQNLTYAYDANDNVSSITDGVAPGNSQSFAYDFLDRLKAATGGYGTFGWTYDNLGNRLQQTLGGVVTNYSYTSGTNRLSSITAAGIATPITYAASGNITSIPPTTGAPIATISYNAANRLNTLTGTALAITATIYDAFGQRFSKSSGGSNTLFIHGQDSTLAEEINAGAPTDHVYLNARPVADITGGAVYYLHADRLGTPQSVTDSGQNIAWSTAYQPFGTAAISVASISQNVRFPGQFFDGEYGGSQNGFRTYIPMFARYLEADPIGLMGGLNPYTYGDVNPSINTDPSGLASVIIVGGPAHTGEGSGTGSLGNPFGHIALATTGEGVFSYGTSEPFGSSTMDYLALQSMYRDQTVIVLDTTQDQENNMILAISAYRGTPYSIIHGHDCATAVLSALLAAGDLDMSYLNDAPDLSVIPGVPATLAQSQPIATKTYFIPAGSPIPPQLKQFNPR